jgi:hypothetical protein
MQLCLEFFSLSLIQNLLSAENLVAFHLKFSFPPPKVSVGRGGRTTRPFLALPLLGKYHIKVACT